nr:FliH/SctL family protein [Microbacterium hydrocarbonoxydans]
MLDSAFTPLVMPRVGEPPLDLRAETEQARARGYADGYAEGVRRARDEAAHQADLTQRRERELTETYLHQRGSALRALDAARDALDARTESVRAVATETIEQLAVELAETILGTELADPARAAAHAVRRAVAEAPVDRWTRVLLSEQDAPVVEADDDLSGLMAGIEVVASSAVDPGGALIEVEDGEVDTRIVHALRRAQAQLRREAEPDGRIS